MTDGTGVTNAALVRAPQFSWKSFGITVGIVFILIGPIGFYFLNHEPALKESLGTAGVVSYTAFFAVFGSLFYGSIIYFPTLLIRKTMFNSEKIERIGKSSEELQGALEQDFVTNLV